MRLPHPAAPTLTLLVLALASEAVAERPVFRTHALSEEETLEFALPPDWNVEVERDEDSGLPRLTWTGDGSVATVWVERIRDLEQAGVIAEGSYSEGDSEEAVFEATFKLLGRAGRELLDLQSGGSVDLEALSPATAIAGTFTPLGEAADRDGYGTAVVVRVAGYVLSAGHPSTEPEDSGRRRFLDAMGSSNVLSAGVRHAAMPAAPRLEGGRFTSATGELGFELPEADRFEQLDPMGLAWRAARGGKPLGVLGVDVYEAETSLAAFDAGLKREWFRAGRLQRGCESARAADGTPATRCRWLLRDDRDKALETLTLVRGDRAVLIGWGGERKSKRYAAELDRLLATLRFADGAPAAE